MGWPAARRGPAGQGSAVSQRGKLARRHARSRDRSPERAVRHSRGAPAHRGGFTRQEEPLMVRKLNNFDEWIDYFRYWQDSIGLPQGEIRKFKFEAKFGEQEVPHIEFGHYKGQRKWPTVMHIPDQRIRDALLNLIVYQGDTEFASVEQQRNLLTHAPSDYDLLALMRVMTEEMRHGWQMSYLLCTHFGDEGKREAAKLLERRADEREHQTEPEKAKLNELSRDLYRQEITKLVERLNMFIPDRDRWLRMPDTKFNRKIGVHAHQRYTVDGQPIDDPEKYAAYLKTVLPQPEHYQTVHDLEQEPSWTAATTAHSLPTSPSCSP